MENTSENPGGAQEFGAVRPDETTLARREVLTTIGRFAYVAPALALLAEPRGALADYGRSESRPGYGVGDKNHDHSGPPGAGNQNSAKTGVWRSVETGRLENGR